MSEYITITDAAARMGISRQAVYMRVHNGSLPAKRESYKYRHSNWLVSKEVVNNLIAAGRIGKSYAAEMARAAHAANKNARQSRVNKLYSADGLTIDEIANKLGYSDNTIRADLRALGYSPAALLDRRNTRRRAIVALHTTEGLTFDEIANRLGYSEATIRADMRALGFETAAVNVKRRRRRLAVDKLRRAGLTIHKIAEAVACSTQTVKSDLSALGYPKQKGKKWRADDMAINRFSVKRLSAGAYKLMEGGGAAAKPRALIFKAWQRNLYSGGGHYTWEGKVFGADEADVIAHNEGFARKRDAVAWAKRWAREPEMMRARYDAFWERLRAAPHNATMPIFPEYRAKGVKSTLADTERANELDASATQRKRIAELHAASLTRHEIAAQLGISVRAVKKDLAALGLGLGRGAGAGEAA